ncbi:TetR/AcrR family transcriptional regulator [Streptomyces sp. NPDC048664]|uniref:TetR/AcrR family transcriptional regulator n=1 Tax=Streptomyces sp. NPDC048664 TaxID=3154505 RepID=UPI0034494C34
MGRVSQEQARQNRERVVEVASRLFREQGTGVSVAELMKAAGLTHGGFYKQFDSKEALVEEAVAQGFGELARWRADLLEQKEGRREDARRAMIEGYLSPRHRDDPSSGCPAAALAADMGREADGSRARRVYADGVEDFTDWLTDEDQDGVQRLCTMLGALVLARAVKDAPLSEEILAAARAALVPPS